MQAADSADQVLEGFSHYVTNEGILRSRVEADTAFFYEPTQITELHKVKVVFFDVKGAESSTLTAQRGTYRWQDGSMEATGQRGGRLPRWAPTRPPKRLRYDNATNLIMTDQQFTFDRGEEHLEGNSFRSDPDFKNVVTDRPRGVYGERHAAAGAMRREAGSGEAGQFALAHGLGVLLPPRSRLPASPLGLASCLTARCTATAKPTAASSRSPTWTGRAAWSRRRRAPTTLPAATFSSAAAGSQVTMQSDSVAAYGGNCGAVSSAT